MQSEATRDQVAGTSQRRPEKCRQTGLMPAPARGQLGLEISVLTLRQDLQAGKLVIK